MGLRDIFKKSTDSKKAGEAAAIEDTNVVADEAPDEIPFGLDVWVEGVDSTVDIIAIHGLNGHREKTWTAMNKVNWLRDANMLSAIIPNARIMSWGYDANTHSTKGLSAMYLYDYAQNLVSDLSLHRRMDKTDTRPIIFIAHSLGGGVVLKSALIHSDSARSNHLYHHKSIKTSTYGIMFMGTPHQGGQGVAWGKRLVNVASIFINTNDKLLNILEQDSQALQQQLGQYNSISGDFKTKFAYETQATPLGLGKTMIVVPKSSAVVPGEVDAEPIPIMDHHINMVKFATQSNDFKRVASHLKLMVDEAPAKVQKNWLTERDIEAARVRSQVNTDLVKWEDSRGHDAEATNSKREPNSVYLYKFLVRFRHIQMRYLRSGPYTILEEEYLDDKAMKESPKGWTAGLYQLQYPTVDPLATIHLSVDWHAFEGDPLEPTFEWLIHTPQSLYYAGTHRGKIHFTKIANPFEDRSVKVQWISPIFSPFVNDKGNLSSEGPLEEMSIILSKLTDLLRSLAHFLAFGPYYDSNCPAPFKFHEFGTDAVSRKLFRLADRDKFARASSFFARAYNVQAPSEDEFIGKGFSNGCRESTTLVIRELLEWFDKDILKDPIDEAWNFEDALRKVNSQREWAVEERKWADKVVESCGLLFMKRAIKDESWKM